MDALGAPLLTPISKIIITFSLLIFPLYFTRVLAVKTAAFEFCGYSFPLVPGLDGRF